MLSMVWDTTRRVRAEQALRESEARYRGVFRTTAVMLVSTPVPSSTPTPPPVPVWLDATGCVCGSTKQALPMDETSRRWTRAC